MLMGALEMAGLAGERRTGVEVVVLVGGGSCFTSTTSVSATIGSTTWPLLPQHALSSLWIFFLSLIVLLLFFGGAGVVIPYCRLLWVLDTLWLYTCIYSRRWHDIGPLVMLRCTWLFVCVFFSSSSARCQIFLFSRRELFRLNETKTVWMFDEAGEETAKEHWVTAPSVHDLNTWHV